LIFLWKRGLFRYFSFWDTVFILNAYTNVTSCKTHNHKRIIMLLDLKKIFRHNKSKNKGLPKDFSIMSSKSLNECTIFSHTHKKHAPPRKIMEYLNAKHIPRRTNVNIRKTRTPQMWSGNLFSGRFEHSTKRTDRCKPQNRSRVDNEVWCYKLNNLFHCVRSYLFSKNNCSIVFKSLISLQMSSISTFLHSDLSFFF